MRGVTMSLRRAALVVLVVATGLSAAPGQRAAQVAGVDLAAGLSNREFWRAIEDISEPDGFFDSDNLVSNEDTYQSVIPALASRAKPNGAYIGVGPDQNFAYLVALDPALAFILDVRRGNLHVHLMYKALIEMSADRADFLARLFSRIRPPGVGPRSSAEELFRAFNAAVGQRERYEANVRSIIDHLTKTRGFPLDAPDRDGIQYVYSNFVSAGPALTFVSSRSGNRYPTWESLQTATDGRGVNRGYLASEANFQKLKTLEQENRIVPVVGNFAGRRALRGIAGFLRSQGLTVRAFYTSNVEQYLFRDRLWGDFIDNARALPIDDTSLFIRSCFNSCSFTGQSRSVTLLDPMAGLLRDVEAGRIASYPDVLAHSGAW